MSKPKLKGNLTIGRPQGNIDTPYIQIEIRDDLSGSCFVTAHVPLAGFAEALTGLGWVECEFDLCPELVGLKRECKEEFVPLADGYYLSREAKETAAQALTRFEVDGWKGRVDDLFNHHRRGKEGARVTFVRYVPLEPQETETKA